MVFRIKAKDWTKTSKIRIGGILFLVVCSLELMWVAVQPLTPTHTTTPASTSPRETLSASTRQLSLQSLWPTVQAEIRDAQLFRAEVKGAFLDEYEIQWSADNGPRNTMANAKDGSSYKEANVDVSGWDPKVPHTITYIAFTSDQQEMGHISVPVKILPPEPGKSKAGATNQAAAAPPISLPPASSQKATAGIVLYVDPNNPARKQANDWRSSRPADAALMDKIGNQPQARWLGGWTAGAQQEADKYTAAAAAVGQMPVLVLYNIPLLHCKSGGASGYNSYVAWVQQVANGIGGRRSLVILEPDALALINCLSAADQQVRYDSLAKAVDILKAGGGTTVYIDAGHGKWVAADQMAQRLYKANIVKADGFSLNVSNFITTEINVSYGVTLSDKLNGRHFVVDTSRNGLGPTADNQWCNPPGRALGFKPTTAVGHPRVDAYLWIKIPGESDGTCNGGPPAGGWWADYALGLAQRAAW